MSEKNNNNCLSLQDSKFRSSMVSTSVKAKPYDSCILLSCCTVQKVALRLRHTKASGE